MGEVHHTRKVGNMATEDTKAGKAWEAFGELLKAQICLMRAWRLIGAQIFSEPSDEGSSPAPSPDEITAPDSVRQTEPTQTRTEEQSPPAEPH